MKKSALEIIPMRWKECLPASRQASIKNQMDGSCPSSCIRATTTKKLAKTMWNRILTATNHPEPSSAELGSRPHNEGPQLHFFIPDTWQAIDENTKWAEKKRAWYTNIYLFMFQSRLHWWLPFHSKVWTGSAMEFRPNNSAYLIFPYCAGAEGARLLAWYGCTGVPYCWCLYAGCSKKTGYINFRMRAMVCWFSCHHLNVDWRNVELAFLAAQFWISGQGFTHPQSFCKLKTRYQ
jgi:hypothetical protein